MTATESVIFLSSQVSRLISKISLCVLRSDVKRVLVCAFGISTSWAVQIIMRNRKKQQDVIQLRNLKLTARQNNFDEIRLLLTGNEFEYEEILAMPFKELRFKLQSRKVKARTVVEAYIWKSLDLASSHNCVSEFLPSALIVADKLDNLVVLKGPLHGVPFCINDDIDVEGTFPSFSCSINTPVSSPSQENAVIVKILESQGAIPFCRTSSSIICMSYSARNPYFGEVHHPLDKNLSIGGSSSGTACLIAGGGAPFGIATDRGGARLPASLSGLCTVKASRHRISRRGCVQHCVGTTTVPCIMTKRVNELMTLYGLVMEKNQQHRMDPKVVPLSWNRQISSSKQKLRIGYFTSFPVYPVIGDVEEAVRKAKVYLQSCGHIVVNFEPPDDLKCQELWNGLMKVHAHRHGLQNDGTFGSTKHYQDGDISPRVLWSDEALKVKRACSETNAWKRFVEKFDNIPGMKSSRDKAIERMHITMNSDCDLWNTASLREQFVDEVLNSMNDLKVDVIICPVFAAPATNPETLTKLGLLPGVYSFIWNLLDLPAGTVKVWKESGRYLSEEFVQSVNTPLGVQVVGRPYSEELVLRVMNELDELNED